MNHAGIEVLHVCNEVGLGGTERGIMAMARDMRYGAFDHSVACLVRAGARAASLAGHADVRVMEAHGDLRTMFAGKRFDVAIVHRAGDGDSRWCDVLRALRAMGIGTIFEINIFGLVDLTPEDELVDCHLHISKSSYCAFRRRAAASGYGRIERHRVLYIPTDLATSAARQLAPGERERIRSGLGIGPSDFVLLRTGRPDVRKWGDLLMHAIPRVVARIPDARFDFLSAPPSRTWWMAHRSYADRVRVLPPTADDRVLSNAYAIADVYAHSSRRGESFGVSLVEAMAAGLPVVVDSTPWRDNAQIEVVDHLRTGLVANSPESFADALVHLHGHREEAAEMGRRGREKALATYDSSVVCASLAALIGKILRSKGNEVAGPLYDREPLPTPDELEAFWNTERSQREMQSWQQVPPDRWRTPVATAAWSLIDTCEIVARRVVR